MAEYKIRCAEEPCNFFEGIKGNPKRYIGTSCLSLETIDDHIRNLNDLNLRRYNPNRIICAVGFLTTNEVLDPDFSCKKDTCKIGIKDLRGSLAKCGSEIFTLLHHFRKPDYDYRKGQGSFFEDIDKIFSRLGHLPDGIQINNAYVPVDQLEKIVGNYPHQGRRLILQIKEKELEGNLLDYLANYKDVVSSVIIDPSAGNNLKIKSEYAVNTMISINEKYPSIHLVLAGGFDPKNVSQKLIYINRGLIERGRGDLVYSIDAQSQLRTFDCKHPEKGVFDTKKARRYLFGAFQQMQQKI